MELRICEKELTDAIIDLLIDFSKRWEAEQNVYGYRANERTDIEGNRVFLAYDGQCLVGYLFGKNYSSSNMHSIMPDGTACFEVEELYVLPEYRNKSVGRQLYQAACEAMREYCEYVTLSTATKNSKAILHFYIEEVGMTFWSARLFQKL